MLGLLAGVFGFDRPGRLHNTNSFARELSDFVLLIEGLFFGHCGFVEAL